MTAFCVSVGIFVVILSRVCLCSLWYRGIRRGWWYRRRNLCPLVSLSVWSSSSFVGELSEASSSFFRHHARSWFVEEWRNWDVLALHVKIVEWRSCTTVRLCYRDGSKPDIVCVSATTQQNDTECLNDFYLSQVTHGSPIPFLDSDWIFQFSENRNFSNSL